MLIRSSGSWGRLGISTGRSPTRSERSAVRAARFAERTDAKVARPSTIVPAAVPTEAIVAQSAIGAVEEGEGLARDERSDSLFDRLLAAAARMPALIGISMPQPATGISDEERLAREFPVYDALYEYVRQAST